MKKIKLEVLKLRDFKGIKEFEIVLNGDNARIYGDNGAGKTTLFDAFIWLLFDKDSNNNSKFDIKTLNSDGSQRHNLEHTVEGDFDIDGVKLKLKKVYKEKWTRKRGNPTPEFTGHDILYFVDDVPRKKKEYTDMIGRIINEELFKLITSPTYFNEKLDWKKRREMLIGICGDVTDEDVIVSNSVLAKLNDILNGKSMDDMKAIVNGQKKAINEELQSIPVRIDEIRNMMPDEVEDTSKVEDEIKVVETEINDLQEKKMLIRNGSAVLDIKQKIQTSEMELEKFIHNFNMQGNEGATKLEVKLQELNGNHQIISSEMTHINRSIANKTDEFKYLQTDLSKWSEQANELRESWKAKNSETLQHVVECECPSCGQALPGDKVEEAKEKALAHFNSTKSKTLTEISEKGKYAKSQQEVVSERINKIEKEIEEEIMKYEEVKVKLSAYEKEIEKYQVKLKEIQGSVPDINNNSEYNELLSKKNGFKSELETLKGNSESEVTKIEIEISEKTEIKRNLTNSISGQANISEMKERIIQLEDRQVFLAGEYEKIEQTLYLIEEFVRAKVSILTERINSKFKNVSFKLFEDQINGGLTTCCVTTVKGVPYGTGLNTAASINAGLEIINVLTEHFQTSSVIFVDNSESVTEFIDVDSQMINLIVSSSDKKLRVEKGNK